MPTFLIVIVMINFPTVFKVISINPLDSDATTESDERKSMLTIVVYCPNSDFPLLREFLLSQQITHRYSSSIETPINCDTRNAVLAPNVRNPRSMSET